MRLDESFNMRYTMLQNTLRTGDDFEAIYWNAYFGRHNHVKNNGNMCMSQNSIMRDSSSVSKYHARLDGS